MVIAGVIVETIPGAVGRVAARLVGRPGIRVQGGDGRCRLAAVLEAEDGAALEDLADRTLAMDEEILGVYPTLVGAADGAA
jgi:hypothetical protein